MPKSICIDEFLQRVDSQPDRNIWSVLIVPSPEIEETVEEVQEGLEIFLEQEIRTISATKGVSELIKQIENSSDRYLILWELDFWEAKDWQILDRFRSHLETKQGGVFILSFASAAIMRENAPNLLSWLRSRTYTAAIGAEYLTDEEIKIRLESLSKHLGYSHQEIIELAEQNQLPSDPEYGEWLILLDRGDLIVTR
ncbi:MAG: ABC transporter permease [Cyanobacteria bacterium SBLK]|nr:ABC transporter permease [Cyanobacteria bacterium SBLK]